MLCIDIESQCILTFQNFHLELFQVSMFDSMSLWVAGLGGGVAAGGGSQSEGGVDVMVSFFFCGCPRVVVEDGIEGGG